MNENLLKLIKSTVFEDLLLACTIIKNANMSIKDLKSSEDGFSVRDIAAYHSQLTTSYSGIDLGNGLYVDLMYLSGHPNNRLYFQPYKGGGRYYKL